MNEEALRRKISRVLEKAFIKLHILDLEIVKSGVLKVNAKWNTIFREFAKNTYDFEVMQRVIAEAKPDVVNLIQTELGRAYANRYDWSWNEFLSSLDDNYKAAMLSVTKEVPSSSLDDALRGVYYRMISPAELESLLEMPIGDTGMNLAQRLDFIAKKYNFDEVPFRIREAIQKGDNPIDAAREISRMLLENGMEKYVTEENIQAVQRAFRNVWRWSETVCRTEMMLYQQLGYQRSLADFQGSVAGQKYVATLDKRTRETHASLDQLEFYYQPAEGQLHINDMPVPPWEWNCRCTTVPIPFLLSDVQFVKTRTMITPDPAGGPHAHLPDLGGKTEARNFSDWFNNYLTREQQRVILRKPWRYDMLEELLGRPPRWEDAINPSTGRFWTKKQLESMLK